VRRPGRFTIDVSDVLPTDRFNKNKQPLVERLIEYVSQYAGLNSAWPLHPDSRCGEFTQLVEDLVVAKNNAQAGAVWNATLAWGEKWGVVIVV
jgi:hypothetical protein